MISAPVFEDDIEAADPRWRSLEMAALDLAARNGSSAGQSVPLVEELPATVDVLHAFRAVTNQSYPLFLDSALSHPTLGRYSYVTADPFTFLSCRGKRFLWFGNENAWRFEAADAFHFLKEKLSDDVRPPVAGLPPFQGGAAGLFGYGLCHHTENLPRPRWDEFQVPDMAVGIYDWVIAFDHQQNRSWIISTGYPETDADRRRERAWRRLKEIQKLLTSHSFNQKSEIKNQESRIDVSQQWPLPAFPGLTTNFSQEGYLNAVRRAIEYVHAGDCFQVNLAQRLLAPCRENPLDVYLRLRERNPATFGGYFDMGDFVIASASPERFIQLDDNRNVETRPIKGTRARGATPEEDARLKADLRHSPKDRAENIMIVDLLRNDLGRVCEYGSIHVPSLCDLESYETVHHLVSTVRGRLRDGQTALDLLRAAFPGGSVTGAPKIRAMEIIAELEPNARGPYCGSLGYIGFDGSMDTNILIRTFTIGKGWIQFPVGGGIVADSQPEKEYEETLHKAAGMNRALKK